MWNIMNLSVCPLPSIHQAWDKKESLLWRRWFIKSFHQITYVLQLINRTLDNVLWWNSLLLGLAFETVTVRHWTWFSAPRFGQFTMRVWTAKRSGCQQILARCDRLRDLIRVESQPRPRAVEAVVSSQRGGCRTGGESWSNCSLCCHVAVRIGEQSSKGWQWDSLEK